jgi:hypothetical protein
MSLVFAVVGVQRTRIERMADDPLKPLRDGEIVGDILV